MEKTIRLERELAYTGTILKVYRDTVVANGIQETYDYIHHDGAAAVLPVTKDGKLLMVRQLPLQADRFFHNRFLLPPILTAYFSRS